jgi:hypothetical protein
VFRLGCGKVLLKLMTKKQWSEQRMHKVAFVVLLEGLCVEAERVGRLRIGIVEKMHA